MLIALFFISVWLLYVNYKLLQVTKDIHILTAHIDTVSIELCTLTRQMVDNLTMPEPVLKTFKAKASSEFDG